MRIYQNQVYFTVESILWGANFNRIETIEFIEKNHAINYYKSLRKDYFQFDEEQKMHYLFSLAKVQNGQKITLACCGYGVMDNYSEGYEGPI